MSNGYNLAKGIRSPRRVRASVFGAALATLACAVLVVFPGCSRNYSRFLKLPIDPSLESSMGWVAVSSAYASLRERPDRLSAEVSVLRGGSVFKPLGRSIDPEGSDSGGLWYKYEEGSVSGWIRSNDTLSFPSAEQARNYASGSRDK